MTPQSRIGADDPRSVFVYFRTPLDAADETRRRLDLQLAEVRLRTGISGRIGTRVDLGKPYLTWLEIYEGIPTGSLESILREIDAAALDSGLGALALEGRHREVFTMHAPDGLSPMV